MALAPEVLVGSAWLAVLVVPVPVVVVEVVAVSAMAIVAVIVTVSIGAHVALVVRHGMAATTVRDAAVTVVVHRHLGRLGQRGVHRFAVGYQSFHTEHAGGQFHAATAAAAATAGSLPAARVNAISAAAAVAAATAPTGGRCHAACRGGSILGDESYGTVCPAGIGTAGSESTPAERD